MKKIIDIFRKRKKSKNLLVIEQKDINAVPVIFYKGRKIDYIQKVEFHWLTRTETPENSGSKFDVQYVDVEKEEVLREGFSHPLHGLNKKGDY